MRQKDGFQRGAVLLHAHEHKIKAERDGGQDGKKIAEKLSAAELVKKHDNHPRNHKRQGNEMLRMRTLF